MAAMCYTRPLYIVLCWFTFSLLLEGTYADINTRFYVENGQGAVTRSGTAGTYGGSCYNYDADLVAIYDEAIDMAQVAITALGDYASNPTIRATVQTFFGIKPDGTSVSAAHTAYFNYAKNAFQMLVDDSSEAYNPNNKQPGFFCDVSWRWRTEMYYSPTTGTMTGETLSERLQGKYPALYWSPLYREYAGGPKVGCESNTYAFAIADSPQSITMCPLSWNGDKRKDSLKAWRSGDKIIKDGTALKAAMSVPSTVLHELCHMLTGNEIDDLKVEYKGTAYDAYGPTLGAALAAADPYKAIHNADNYRWFAIAIYLDGYDWSRTLAGKGPAANAKRANVTSSDLIEADSLKRKSFFERRHIDWLVEDETDEGDWEQFT